MSREIKQEASVPVQSRVDLVSLAELSIYWESIGHEIRTMSQLVSWSISLMCEVLRANDKMPVTVESVSEANNYMREKGLYQDSMKKRSVKKISNAIAFESLRNEGIDPKNYVPQQYNIVHNKNSVEVIEPEVRVGDRGMGGDGQGKYLGELTEAMKRSKEEGEREFEEMKKVTLESLIESGAIVKE